jgi:hypothetical protein
VRRRAQDLSISSILTEAATLRRRYAEEVDVLLLGVERLAGYDRKRRLPKLRYRASRLIYLATDEVLIRLAGGLDAVPELAFHRTAMKAVATGNVQDVIGCGTNAVQAAAQPLRACGRTAMLDRRPSCSREYQGLAVLGLNGVPVAGNGFDPSAGDELSRFAFLAGAERSFMESNDPFIRELACLHGSDGVRRHPAMLECAFDEDDDLSLDAIDQLRQSGSP